MEVPWGTVQQIGFRKYSRFKSSGVDIRVSPIGGYIYTAIAIIAAVVSILYSVSERGKFIKAVTKSSPTPPLGIQRHSLLVSMDYCGAAVLARGEHPAAVAALVLTVFRAFDEIGDAAQTETESADDGPETATRSVVVLLVSFSAWLLTA